mmetsp:Transcript_9091/g.27684  ORF Transcript_9091/g.27684 Transcript_9091/m.27684 type:complete len:200 (+) Transcript_9091:944-1543(+)
MDHRTPELRAGPRGIPSIERRNVFLLLVGAERSEGGLAEPIASVAANGWLGGLQLQLGGGRCQQRLVRQWWLPQHPAPRTSPPAGDAAPSLQMPRRILRAVTALLTGRPWRPSHDMLALHPTQTPHCTPASRASHAGRACLYRADCHVHVHSFSSTQACLHGVVAAPPVLLAGVSSWLSSYCLKTSRRIVGGSRCIEEK